jgi:hypothetical protein
MFFPVAIDAILFFQHMLSVVFSHDKRVVAPLHLRNSSTFVLSVIANHCESIQVGAASLQ